MNVALIGFMGTGKTYCGEIVAKKLDMAFVEVDQMISEREGKSIPDIFVEQGEEGFRKLETTMLKEVLEQDNQLISCGGGIVTVPENVVMLRKKAKVILLTASAREILQRVGDDTNRPLLQVPDKLGKIEELLASRRALYEAAAHITINTDGMSISEEADAVISHLKD